MSPTQVRSPSGQRRGIDPRIRQRRIEVARRRGRRRLHFVLAAAAVVVLVAAGIAVLHTPWFSVRGVTVRGSHPHTTTRRSWRPRTWVDTHRWCPLTPGPPLHGWRRCRSSGAQGSSVSGPTTW